MISYLIELLDNLSKENKEICLLGEFNINILNYNWTHLHFITFLTINYSPPGLKTTPKY